MDDSNKYTIPAEFQAELQLRDVPEKRSDEELRKSLHHFQPVTSEKNIWAYWHAGFDAMPKWCQHNVVDWMRICGPSWSVRVIDSVSDSPNNALKYVSAEDLPEAFVKGTMDGPYTGPHSADMLRGACLYHFGGVFMDVGNILIRSLDRICWNQLEDPASPYQVATPWMYGETTTNHFVACRKGDPFIKRWHELFVHLWRNRTNHSGMINDPLVSFAKENTFEESRSRNFEWDFKVPAVTVFEYITQVVSWQRVCKLEDPNDGFNGPEYWTKHILIWDCLPEQWGGEETLGFAGSGEKMFQLFSVRTDADPESTEYREAYHLCWRLLTKSSVQKITHGKGLTNSIHLGVLWDENEGTDCKPGTFAELLRYGTVHFQQTRESIEYREAPQPSNILKKGLLEP